MVLLFWSVKGGSGVTVVAAATALLSARRSPTVLVDLGGDAFATLGLPEPLGPGALDWLAAPKPTASALFALASDASDDLRVIGPGAPPAGSLSADDWDRLLVACASQAQDSLVVIDAGGLVPPDDVPDAVRSLFVVRPCFLALRRAASASTRPTAIVLVCEPGRALTSDDVERALGGLVVAEVPWDPAVARAVDAGLLASRLPQTLGRPLRPVVRTVAA